MSQYFAICCYLWHSMTIYSWIQHDYTSHDCTCRCWCHLHLHVTAPASAIEGLCHTLCPGHRTSPKTPWALDGIGALHLKRCSWAQRNDPYRSRFVHYTWTILDIQIITPCVALQKNRQLQQLGSCHENRWQSQTKHDGHSSCWMTLDETTVFFHTYWNILNHVVETTCVYTGAYWRCKMCNEMSQKDVTGLHALQLYGSSKGFKPASKFRVQEFCVIGWMIVNPPAFVRFV